MERAVELNDISAAISKIFSLRETCRILRSKSAKQISQNGNKSFDIFQSNQKCHKVIVYITIPRQFNSSWQGHY